jgi:GTP-binding protein
VLEIVLFGLIILKFIVTKTLAAIISHSASTTIEIVSDPAYPGQWRVNGPYIEQVAKMTHWEYPEAVERFGRLLHAVGIADELTARGAIDGDLVMIDEYDFDFSPGMTNMYIPQDLLERDALYEEREKQASRAMLLDNNEDENESDDEEEEEAWKPFNKGGYMYIDKDEIVEFNDDGGWDLLEDDFDLSPDLLEGDEVWTS